LTAPGYEEADQKAIHALMTTGSVTPYEKEYICKDGKKVPVLVGAALLPGTHQVVAFILDISERRKQEQIIRESEARFRRLFESNLIGIKFSDADGTITEA
jgi:PAS domain S-box-containing protein